MDHETVQATALKVVFDLLHLFGLEAFSQKGRGQQDGCGQQDGRGQEGDVSGMSEGQEPTDGDNSTVGRCCACTSVSTTEDVIMNTIDCL